jgi:hypothetical protein
VTFPEPLQTFVEPLVALQRLLDRFGEQGVIIGGIATGFLGKPRFTIDLDVDRIRRWVKSFADVLQTPSLWADIENMFK